jgi:hypothetical protein
VVRFRELLLQVCFEAAAVAPVVICLDVMLSCFIIKTPQKFDLSLDHKQ